MTEIRKTPQTEEEYLTQARAEANAGKVVYKALSASELIELQEELERLRAEKQGRESRVISEDEVEQARRQTGYKPPQYQIGIDTFERSKANQMAETRVEIAKFMIDKYVWRKKGQDKEDFQKIKDYCDFAIEALNEIGG